MNRNAVACAEPYGAEAARAIFQQGGNAVDAAVAAAFAQCVANPLGVGIGGTGMMHVYNAAEQTSIIVDGSVTIPSGAGPETFLADAITGRAGTTGRFPVKGNPNQYGYKSVMVPGFVRGASDAFETYGSGKVSWSAILEPAIQLAQEGYEVYPYLAEYYRYHEPSVPNALDFEGKMQAFPRAAALVTKDGRPYRVGDVIVLKEMGQTLATIAQDGADAFYSGPLGQAMADDFQANGGFITADDLSTYKARRFEPLRAQYRGYEIATSQPPGRGLALVLMLKILEGYDLAARGWNTPAYIDLLARVQQHAFIKVSRHMMDPNFAEVPVEYMTSKEHVDKLREQIERREHATTLAPNTYPHTRHTTHVSTVDEKGNAVSFTHSIGSVAASCVVTPGLGFIYNNFLGHFNPVPGYANSIVAGKRGGGGIPTLIFKDGALFMAIGSSGGSPIISGVMQSIVNVIDHGMHMAEAIAVPRFHCEENDTIYANPEIFGAVLDEVRERGFVVKESTYMGCNQGILIEPTPRQLQAGTDPRGGRGVAYC